MAHRTWRIGLTGGIGSGKSTVAGFLARKGAAIIDADAISRSLTSPKGRAMPAIEQTFGSLMVGLDGAMDRDAMRALIFQNPQAKRQLEGIIHPLVGVLSQEMALNAMRDGHTVLLFDVPLLVESGARWRAQLDRILVVDCEVQTQRQRVFQRSGLSLNDTNRIMAQQATRTQRLACADIVIFNEGLNFDGLEHLTGLVAADFGL